MTQVERKNKPDGKVHLILITGGKKKKKKEKKKERSKSIKTGQTS